MSQEILLKFFEISLIDLKGDDSKLDKLRATIKDLSATLSKSPAMTAAFTAVAADPDVASSDATIEYTMSALRKQWQTVANLYPAKPVAILRAMLLDAVIQSARGNDAIAVAFVNTARNALPYVESADERPIWLAAVENIEEKVDARAEAEWATPETISVSPLVFSAPAPQEVKTKAPSFDTASLTEKVSQAVMYTNHGGKNPHHIQNNAQAWAQEYSNKLSAAIGEEVDAVLKSLKPEKVDFAGPLIALADAVTAHVYQALTAFSGATSGLQRRTNLLWWKEALYSPSVHASYRELPLFQAAALMALDLHNQVPIFSPASVSAFLKEAIRSLPADGTDSQCDALALLQEARTQDSLAPLRKVAAALSTAPASRGPLLSLIGHPSEPPDLDAEALYAFGGIKGTAIMTPATWGTHIFRELQAARATSVSVHKRAKKKD